MDRDIFREELVDYIDEGYKEFVEYQELGMEILKVFHELCCENNITYYLAYGSLLGAIRDKNIIPWDYDIDVQVPYNEKERLRMALKTLDKKYYVDSPEENSNCTNFFPRISIAGFDSDLLHVDIFYIIGSPKNLMVYKWFNRLIRKITEIRVFKTINAKKRSNNRKLLYYYFLFNKIIFKFVPLPFLNFVYNRLCKMYDFDTCEFITIPVSGERKRYNKVDYDHRELHRFGMNEFYIPSGAVHILSTVYGDYLHYPSMASRFEEVFGAIKRFKQS